MEGTKAKPVVVELMTPDEVAAIYKVTGKTVRDWFAAGLIPAAAAVGRTIRFDPEDVADALRTRAEMERGRKGKCPSVLVV